MNARFDKTKESKDQSLNNQVIQRKDNGKAPTTFVDNRPEAIAQRKLQEGIRSSGTEKTATTATTQKEMAPPPLAGGAPNNTGMPDNLKEGIEKLSGLDMSDVKVHYNSDKPEKLGALAYAQGTDIYLGPGQETHLAHEAWHVVQQKEGRVAKTMQLKGGVNVNDDGGLEKEADMMGEKALLSGNSETAVNEEKADKSNKTEVVQRMTMTISKVGVKNDGLLDMEENVLTTGYNSKARTAKINDDTIDDFKAKKTLAAQGGETLIINAHGSAGTLAGRTAAEFAQLLIDVGATGYSAIHIYGCQAGMPLFDFGLDVSKILKIPVWGPKGNIKFNTGTGEYMVSVMTYDAQQQKWVPDGDKVFDKDDAWWYFEDGIPMGQGTPETPNSFPVEQAPEDDTDWSQFITVDSSSAVDSSSDHKK